ncbi:MAG TPA: N-glycosylase/DNA lyase [Candidatus Nanoarchaeia archaeon]|nr:N-glycosylase/DNA lyase [Candidatus Nanoarchaeia archaeon]
MGELIGGYQKKKKAIESRIREFKNAGRKEKFYELCFCILTPQSSARKCDNAVNELKKVNFRNVNIDPKLILRKNGVRFHNNKSKYLIEMKEKYSSIKLNGNSPASRDFLVANIKGLGLKEASHFLRNVGYSNLAILDRHILKNLVRHKVINEIPKSLSRKNYLEIEGKFIRFADRINIPMDHLDLLFWSFETGEVFK